MRGHSSRGINCQAPLDEISGRHRHPSPVLDWCERVIGNENGLHFFEIRVPIKRSVATEEKVGDDPDCPNVPEVGQQSFRCRETVLLHWFAMSHLLEDLRCHVPWCSTGGRKDVEGVFVHNSRQSKIRNEEVGVVFGCSKQQVLRLQIPMDDAMIV